MTNKKLSPKTERLLKLWYICDLDPSDKTQLIASLIEELNQTKQKVVKEIQMSYLKY